MPEYKIPARTHLKTHSDVSAVSPVPDYFVDYTEQIVQMKMIDCLFVGVSDYCQYYYIAFDCLE